MNETQTPELPFEPAGPVEFISQLERTVQRLTSMSLARLERRDEDGLSPAMRAHEISMELAELAGVDAQVPFLKAHAAGSQLAVVGRDLLERNPMLDLALAAEQLCDLRNHLY